MNFPGFAVLLFIYLLGNPRSAVSFTLPIRAQQVSDPGAEEFSLNTTFTLLSKRELWLADSQMQITESSDIAFPEGKFCKKLTHGGIYVE